MRHLSEVKILFCLKHLGEPYPDCSWDAALVLSYKFMLFVSPIQKKEANYA
jgi:hypothetical protein